MRNTYVRIVVLAGVLVATNLAPALAQEAESTSTRPWHYWIAPFLLAGGVLVIVAVGVGYWVRVLGGRGRR